MCNRKITLAKFKPVICIAFGCMKLSKDHVPKAGTCPSRSDDASWVDEGEDSEFYVSITELICKFFVVWISYVGIFSGSLYEKNNAFGGLMASRLFLETFSCNVSAMATYNVSPGNVIHASKGCLIGVSLWLFGDVWCTQHKRQSSNGRWTL